MVAELLNADDQMALIVARRYCRTGELKALRERLGLSADETARILGCTTRVEVWRWEQGTVPKGDRALALGRLILEWLVLEQHADGALAGV
ncbi:MAG TPA: helix-turn-helix domain-containing protein [Candidatus Acidoferrales bacterium]|nr:helix-turn-helix domain-containing protein [Candidatus Acidoferrales bacterium]